MIYHLVLKEKKLNVEYKLNVCKNYLPSISLLLREGIGEEGMKTQILFFYILFSHIVEFMDVIQ